MATLDDVRKLQKRARDKEYRIRKQAKAVGYIPGQKNVLASNISTISPRQDWNQVKDMSPVQLNRYARQLSNFNTKAKFVGSASGDVIPKKYLDQALRLIKSRNKFVRAERARIAGIAPDLWEQYRVQQEGILKKSGIGGFLTEIDVSKLEPPRSLAAAKRRVKSFQSRAKHDFAFYRKIQRRNMISQLYSIGEYDLAELVRSMNRDQFDLLSSVLPMWQRLEIEYYDPTEEKAARQDVRSYVYKAWGTAYPGTDPVALETRLDKNIDKRAEAGRRRAKALLAKETAAARAARGLEYKRRAGYLQAR